MNKIAECFTVRGNTLALTLSSCFRGPGSPILSMHAKRSDRLVTGMVAMSISVFYCLLETHSLEEKGTQGLTLKYVLVERIAVKQSTRLHDVSVEVFSSSYNYYYDI